jgi:hypothetical protein
MEDKMYVFYLKSDKVAEVIGYNLVMDCDKVLVFKEKKIRASFMFDGIEGFITKNIENNTEVTEDDTRKE